MLWNTTKYRSYVSSSPLIPNINQERSNFPCPAFLYKSQIVFNDSNDYRLNPGEKLVWISVDSLSIYIAQRPCDGVEVELYKEAKMC
jgi:hypothetical protein